MFSLLEKRDKRETGEEAQVGPTQGANFFLSLLSNGKASILTESTLKGHLFFFFWRNGSSLLGVHRNDI